jgi:hypothetical protein
MYKQLLCQLTKIHYTTRKTPTGHYFNTKNQYCALSLCQKMSLFLANIGTFIIMTNRHIPKKQAILLAGHLSKKQTRQES